MDNKPRDLQDMTFTAEFSGIRMLSRLAMGMIKLTTTHRLPFMDVTMDSVKPHSHHLKPIGEAETEAMVIVVEAAEVEAGEGMEREKL